jgi:hypothetical protein
MPVRRAAQIPRLVHNPGCVLAWLNRLTGLPTLPDVRLHAIHTGLKLPLIVERSHHDMPPLPPLRVIAVMTQDKAIDAVVVGINSRHRPTLSRAQRASSAPEPGTWPGGHGRNHRRDVAVAPIVAHRKAASSRVAPIT